MRGFGKDPYPDNDRFPPVLGLDTVLVQNILFGIIEIWLGYCVKMEIS